MIKFLNDSNFQTEINKDYILVDFYADWCGPCKMLGTVLEEVDFIDVLKVNVDKYPDIAKEYGVMSIPTIGLFSKQTLLKKEIGFMPLEELKTFVEATKKEIN